MWVTESWQREREKDRNLMVSAMGETGIENFPPFSFKGILVLLCLLNPLMELTLQKKLLFIPWGGKISKNCFFLCPCFEHDSLLKTIEARRLNLGRE